MKIPRKAASAHWYHKDGTPCHEVTAKTTGLPRPTTVSDARKLGLIPSVTNILGVSAKPQLITWLQDNAIRAALATPRNPDEPEEQWLARIAAESDKIGENAASLGTLIHEQIETYNRECTFNGNPEIVKLVERYPQWFADNIETVIDCEAKVVGDGYAGRLDLYAMLKIGRRAVIDFKSQKLVGKPKPNFYRDWSMQLAAYGAAVKEPDDQWPVLMSVIIASDATVDPIVKVWDEPEKAFAAFECCKGLWSFNKDYWP